jgi:hypothetical protein
VIIGDPKTKSPALFRAMGRFVESLGGKYITAEDMNIGVADLEIVRQETRWVTGLSRAQAARATRALHGARLLPRHARRCWRKLRLAVLQRAAACCCKASAPSAAAWPSCCTKPARA